MLRPDGTAVVSMTVFMDGELHAAWGGSAITTFTWVRSGSSYVVTGGGLTFTLTGDTVRFDIPNRCPSCDAFVRGTVSSG